MGRPRRVLVLVHPFFHPKQGRKRATTEFDVWATLRRLGHVVEIAAAEDNLRRFDRQLGEFKPDVVFNLLEEFHGEGVYDFHLVSYLEALAIPYTGCSPRGLILSRNKYWTTLIAASSGIRVPQSQLGYQKYAGSYPALVKFNREHASLGLNQSCVVHSHPQLKKSAQKMHQVSSGELIVQEFIPGIEVSVGVLGNSRPKALAPWRLRLPSDFHIASQRVKFSARHRSRRGIRSLRLKDDRLLGNLQSTALQAFSILDLNGYARLDFRVNAFGEPFLIDVNANPCLARDEDFAKAATEVDLSYPDLVNRIVDLGLSYQPRR